MRIAEAKDFHEIMDLYEACRIYLNEQGVDQWAHGYPTESIVTNDLENGDLWLRYDQGRLSAVVVLNQSAAKRYDELQWSCEGQHHLEVHRLAVNPRIMNQGTGKMVMSWIEERAKVQGACCIRLDTYTKNTNNIRFYKNLGYKTTGCELLWPPLESPFVCLEKLL